MDAITSVRAEVVRLGPPAGGGQTVRATVTTAHGEGVATLPAGISVGAGEALLMTPHLAVRTISETIGPLLHGQDVLDQRSIDQQLMELDGTPDRSRVGANALLPVSLAVARAAAAVLQRELYEHIAELSNNQPRLPETIVVTVEGGKHTTGSSVTIQEFSLIDTPERATTVIDRLEATLTQAGREVSTGGQGGLVIARSMSNEQVLEQLARAATRDGGSQPRLALDVAASHGTIPEAEVRSLVEHFPVAVIEDPLEQNQLEHWSAWTKALGATHLIAADDLTVGNPCAIKDAVEASVANALVVKLNQTATLSELFDLIDLVRVGNWQIIVSHRGTESLDDFITDLAVGTGAEYLKAGSPRRPERRAKYDRLLAIKAHQKRG